MSIFAVTLLALGIGLTMAIARAALGPTSFDRVLAINTAGTVIVLAICVYGFFDGRPSFSTLRCFTRLSILSARLRF